MKEPKATVYLVRDDVLLDSLCLHLLHRLARHERLRLSEEVGEQDRVVQARPARIEEFDGLERSHRVSTDP